MDSKTELMMAMNLVNSRQAEAQLRQEVLKQLHGMKYWLYLFGF